MTADHLGIDSLVAVDIRSWFIKEFQVEIPVLKILSGATVAEILARVQELLPQDLTPNLNPNAKGPSKTKQEVEKTKAILAASPRASSSNLESRDDNSTQAKAVHTVSHPVSIAPKKPNGIASAASNELVDHTPLIASTTSSSQADVLMTDSAESTLSSSPISWSEIDKAETRSGDSELSVKLPNISISTCLEQNKLLDAANSTVSRTAPISFAQSRFWFLEQFLENPASALNITLSIDLHGSVDVKKLQKAVALVGQRHEALRT